MKIARMIGEIARYIAEGFVRIFSPTDDEYPAIGIQPFEGTIYIANSQLNW